MVRDRQGICRHINKRWWWVVGGGVCGLVRWLCAGKGGDGFPLHGGVWTNICVARVER
jgi:hypothetical protein